MTDGRKIGLIGMAVMGRNLALNLLDRGYRAVIYSREPEEMESAARASAGRLEPAANLAELVRSLERPRVLLMMIRAGAPVDEVMEQLAPLLDPGDVVMDGGNSFFKDTRRRERRYAERGLRFLGVGVSGGEEGARRGPSLMPGGDPAAYQEVRPILESIAASTDAGPCVTHVGPDGAGHFVKMVHNGIEYADMQCIAEAYHVLKDLGGLGPEELGELFAGWNRGRLESFLMEVTARVFEVRDPRTGGFLIDDVLDRAGQKGTGRWTAEAALELGVPAPTIAAAIDARVFSSRKDQRLKAAPLLGGLAGATPAPDPEELAAAVHDALLGSKICAYAQGLDLIRTASAAYGWDIDLAEVARIWKGGCILRARFLDEIRGAFRRDAALSNLVLDAGIAGSLAAAQARWRQVVGQAQAAGVPVAGLASGLFYVDSLRARDLPQNLTQAQRDAFGAHTYQRKSDPEGPFVHTDWLGTGAD